MVRKNVSISKEHDLWLKENCISPSRFFQKYIALEIAAQNNFEKVQEESARVINGT